MKTTVNHQFPALLPPLVHPNTAIVTLQNGLGNEEQLAGLFGPHHVLGGLCFVCLNRLAPGLIEHIAHGDIVLGEYQRASGPRARAIAALFEQAGISCELADDLERAHWDKLVWNIPFNGLGVASAAGYEAVIAGRLDPRHPKSPCLTTDRLLGDVRWRQLARELMLEVVAAANAHGFAIHRQFIETRIALTRRMGAYKPSSLVDFERGQALELESLFRLPLRAAQKRRVPAPRLAALCSVLQQLDPGAKIPADR